MENVAANERNSFSGSFNVRGGFNGIRPKYKPVPIKDLIDFDSDDDESDGVVPSEDSEEEPELENASQDNQISAENNDELIFGAEKSEKIPERNKITSAESESCLASNMETQDDTLNSQREEKIVTTSVCNKNIKETNLSDTAASCKTVCAKDETVEQFSLFSDISKLSQALGISKEKEEKGVQLAPVETRSRLESIERTTDSGISIKEKSFLSNASSSSASLSSSSGGSTGSTTIMSTRDSHKVTDTPLKHVHTMPGRPMPCLSHRNIFQTPHDKFDKNPSKNTAQTPATIFSQFKNNFSNTPLHNPLSNDTGQTPIQSTGHGRNYEVARHYNSGHKGARRPLVQTMLSQQSKENSYHKEAKHLSHLSILPIVPESENDLQCKKSLVDYEKDKKVIKNDNTKLSEFPLEQEAKENKNVINLPSEKKDDIQHEVNNVAPNVSKANSNSNVKHFALQPTTHPQKSTSEKKITGQSVNNNPATKPSNVQCSVPPSPMPNSQRNKILIVKGRQYLVLGTIGKGMSGEVLRVQDLSTQELCAIKCVNLSRMDKEAAQGCLDEIKMLNKLQAPSVVHMFDFEIKDPWVYVVMEMGETDLSSLLRSIMREKRLPIIMVLFYWTEMLSAVKHIHDNGVIHSDLKPANFILVKGRLKLIDFGIASSINSEMTSVMKDSQIGTLNYISPEALMDANSNSDSPNRCVAKYKISKRSDVWSLGCILYSLIYGFTPFQHIRNQWAKIAAITNPKPPISFPRHSSDSNAEPIPPLLIDVMIKCLQHEPKARPTVDELLRVPYVTASRSLNTAVNNISPTTLVKVKNALTEDEWRQFTQVLDKSRQQL